MKKCALILMLALLLSGCAALGGEKLNYTQISQDEAKRMMARDDGHLIVDVRRRDEYDAGHIPGALLLPNESILAGQRPAQLPDPDQILLIYCRSGNRSKQAARKLGDMGYTQVYEFGGINAWDGEVAPGGAKAVLSFHSFDGGGPDFSAALGAPIAACEQSKTYSKPNHAELDGAGFTVTFTLTGLTPGETTLTVAERSPIGGNQDHLYAVRVDGDLNVTAELLAVSDLDAATAPTPTLVIAVGGSAFYAALADNPSAAALAEKLSSAPIEVHMRDYGGFEKVGPLPWELPRSDASITAGPGDVILYQGSQITVYYGQNTWDFTRLATIENVTREELLAALGEGEADVSFWVEWSE